MSPPDGFEETTIERTARYTHTGSGKPVFNGTFHRFLQRILGSVDRLLYGNPLYFIFLTGRTPRRLNGIPPDPWPGDRERGEAILQNTFPFLGTTIRAKTNLWNRDDVDTRWLAELHGFAWLRDLRTIGTDTARRRARDLVLDWIAHNRFWHPTSWRADVLGTRMAAWAGHGDFLCAGAPDSFRAIFLTSFARQARHLHRVAPGHLQGPSLFAVAKGLIYAGAVSAKHEFALQNGLQLLEKELPRQIYPDGGHILRSPEVQLAVLRDLAEIRALLMATHREVPDILQSATDRMGVMLRFFRHGDGGLALFNGTCEGESWLIDMVLGRADAQGSPPESTPYAGFERLVAGRTLLLFDVGVPEPAPPGTQQTHAGTLSFEMSCGKERLVVNGGAYVGNKDAWRDPIRSTAAHSTVTIDDKNSSEILSDGRIGRRPHRATCCRDEKDGNIWIETSHDGYQALFGRTHHRRLYLSANGEDFRGEDCLEGEKGSKFDIRFLLHPNVSASLARDGVTVLLRLPKGGGWKFQAVGGVINLEKNVYLGDAREMHHSEQIVVSAPLESNAVRVKWTFKRIPARAA
ncbi:MAG: hypothetical protein COA65_07145 [Rhodospirillaceae bacterium]|nr:MAG: hypothetical protein COA65_07145 [Rhodospirillaceae bacterium]